MKRIEGSVCAPKGYSAAGVHCGIRANQAKKDLALIVSDKIANAAAVYTSNLVKGAPLLVTKENLADGKARAVICNSGNANTCNANGIEVAETMAKLTGDVLGIPAGDVDDNRTFFMRFTSEVTQFHVYIFNRAGHQVFQSSDPSFVWDGTSKGTLLPQGAYVWAMRFRDSSGKLREAHGSVTLIR